MIKDLRHKMGRYYHNLNGWRTSQKIVVIESDDWGSIRMPDKISSNNLLNQGIKIKECPFLTYDTIETCEDFEALFEVLNKFTDRRGKHPILTANYIMGNPDFDKIAKNNFESYFFKPFTEELKENHLAKDYFKTLNQGITEDLIKPQLHGREHLNVALWMKFLKDGHIETRKAFYQKVYGISTNISNEKRRSFLAALDYQDESELETYIKPALIEAVDLFESTFGFNSTTFIAPNYVWDREIENTLMEKRILGFQSSRFQKLSMSEKLKGKEKMIKRITGEKNSNGQLYIVRNATFEPSTVNDKFAHAENCLKYIKSAFFMRKPAIISMHRLNFIGGLNEKNRTENLTVFTLFLNEIMQLWPDVIFMSSDELVTTIKNSRND